MAPDPPHVLVLGGYGMAGLPIARLLMEHTPVRVTVAGRSQEKATQAAAALNADFPGGRVNRVRGLRTDASDAGSLLAAFEAVDLVVDCTPTTAHVATVTRAALDAEVDYLDILYGPNKLDILHGLEDRIREAGRCFITEAGYHPGLPSALVRYAAACLDKVDSAIVGGLLNIPIPYTPAVDDLVREIESTSVQEYRDGAWCTPAWNAYYRKIDFGPPYGTRPCTPMYFHEMQGLPEQYGLERTGFYIASFGWVADWLVFMPWYLFKLGRTDWGANLGGRLLVWSTERSVKPPHGVVLKLEAQGTKDGTLQHLDLFARHPDGYLFTAIPVVACLLQYLDGSLRQPGLWLMGQAVEPVRLMRDMARMGIDVEERLTAVGQVAES